MSKILVVLLALTPFILCTNINLYHDEIDAAAESDESDIPDMLNHFTGDREELKDVLKGRVKKYLMGNLAGGKYLGTTESDAGSADQLHDPSQSDENQLFRDHNMDVITMDELLDKSVDNDDDDDDDDNKDGHASDKSDYKSPIDIDEKYNGQVVNAKGQMILHGDILMTEAEERQYFGPHNETDDEKLDMEQDINKNVAYWVDGKVPYTIDGSLQGGWFTSHKIDARDAIDDAKAEFASKTCIRLIPRTTETNYVSFHAGTGCTSQIGMVGNKQWISLASGCGNKKTAIHEVMHALGFWHEQSRPDRNTYITVNYDKIEEGKEGNFDRYTWDQVETFDHPYDYHSIMHYERTAFGKTNWLGQRAETITPKQDIDDFGQCNDCGMTNTDAAQLIRLYCSKEQSTVPSYEVLQTELKMMMSAFRSQSNDDFRKTLLDHLKLRYPDYHWTVSVYNAVTGDSTHSFQGYCGYAWRYFNKNVVACYSKKTSAKPSSTEQETIAQAVFASVEDKGCNAKWVRETAWEKANSYGYKIAMVHSVRHGNGLRARWNAATKFANYRCQRECKDEGWWLSKKNVCTDHMSTLIVMFGGPN